MVGRNRDCRNVDFSLLARDSFSRSRSLLAGLPLCEEEWLLELLIRKKFLIFVGRWPDSLECFREGSERPGKFPRFSLDMAEGLDAKSCVMTDKSR
jgi:hypothetical protein